MGETLVPCQTTSSEVNRRWYEAPCRNGAPLLSHSGTGFLGRVSANQRSPTLPSAGHKKGGPRERAAC